MQTHKHKEDSSISPKLVLPTFVWLWLLCKKTTLKRVFKKETETREERERNKYGVESANCNVSPTRQRLLLLIGKTSNMCVQSHDH